LHLPAARERVGLTIEVRGLESQPLQYRRALELDAVPLVQPKTLLQIAVTMEHRVMLGGRDRVVTEPLLERVHFRLHREELVERARRLVEHGTTRVDQAVLRKIADGQRRRFQDGSRVRFVETGHHPHQRRLPGAIRATETDALAIGDLPRDAIEEHTIAKRFCEF
jgi:hypothetical protein